MSEKIARTASGEKCGNCQKTAGYCHDHDASDDPDAAEGAQRGADDAASALGIPTERSEYEREATQNLVETLYGKGIDEDDRSGSRAATAAKYALRAAADGANPQPADFRAMFGPCERCGERGANGFAATHCYGCQQESQDSGGDSDADGSPAHCPHCGGGMGGYEDPAYCPQCGGEL